MHMCVLPVCVLVCMCVCVCASYYLLLLLSSFTSLGTGRRTQEDEPVRGAYP